MSHNEHWRERDLNCIWHPCTQMQDHEQNIPLIPIRRAEGVWLEDFDGKRYLDAMSSWWVNLFGHCHPRISEAIAAQASSLEQVIFAGFSHQPAVELAERLVDLAPPGLQRVFFADNGSSAVEVALKLSFHYWYNQGQTRRTRYVALSNSYHGETLGALAVSDVGLYRDIYRPLLLQPIVAPAPDCVGQHRSQWAACSAAAADQLDQLLAERKDEICAVILEPLVQCAGGMRMYDAEYLRRVRAACDRHHIHFIADEIAVGFGRTGSLFACEQAMVSPDLMCLSKGITGGSLPLATVLMNEAIYQAFYEDYNRGRSFLHSHSYSGNPIACAAALATLDLFEETPVLENNQRTAAHLAGRAAAFSAHPQVGDVRQTGMVLAIEIMADPATREPYPWQERRGIRAYRHALSRGVLMRPLGNVLYCMPPYVINDEEVDLLMDVMAECVEVATGVPW
ncbi:MAG: adenosylmethionine--8-amino-7-oxononanoate transaminase [Wenzhouxiangellaceae bacterium]